ncbi:ABC-F family ATP-binding cassette domain-containing protein [Domibacillus epiphyticus]|uniref:Multidrug ABC transporter ATP-binding protein n=1 Tax=Domibacillus epiphyticus TaxID=1714355 RepID=A0A1V2AB10_9BACI|nr:ABC-F type ribosomal protection protein [Domibacillus epiphyticus]OMP67984.1 multidrug ABC transporter ATP-binding protein [Domibacillus epiphyticus]
MILLQVQQLSKYYGAELILSNIKLEVQSGDRIALVGRNGAGKSTLLKIIAGQLSHEAGAIMKPKDVTIGYLAQDTGLESDLSIWDEMNSVFDGIRHMEQQLRTLEADMANPGVYGDPKRYEQVMTAYDQLQNKFKEAGGYQYEADLRSILHGFHFHEFDYGTLISTLSGGQKTRLALAKLLLTKPDILILDEPTNHLDIDTLSWLEQYLQGYSGAILIVSHDRYFLDKTVNQVYEVSRHKIRKYTGNYSKYLSQKAEQYEREMKQFEKQQEEAAKLEAFIQRNIARASTTKRAQSRRKQLDRMEMMARPEGDEKPPGMLFDINRQSGNEVLKVNQAAIGYDENKIASDLSFDISRGESIALVGPNGAGKSTLLKSITGALPLLSGDIHTGAGVEIGYYDQEQSHLNRSKTVLAELWDDYPGTQEKDIRTILGTFLFSGDDVLKPVAALSGGEKARLALAKLTMEKANLLILDEPTNHLDLDSKEVLENALIDYPGTLLFVSHDRYFINRIATKVIELDKSGVTVYLGDYDYYVEKKNEQEELAALDTVNTISSTPKPAAADSYKTDKEQRKRERQRIRRIEEIESEISIHEEKIKEAEELLCLPDIYEDHEKSLALQQQLEQSNNAIELLMEEWESLQDK